MSVYLRGKTWYIGYSYNGQWIREAVGNNKAMAKKALEIRKADILTGKYKLAPKKQRLLFKEFANEFLTWAKEHRKERTFKRYEISVKQLISYFGSKPINEIHPFHIEQFKHKRKEHVSGSTVNRDLACLKRMFTLAITWGRSEKNPVSKIDFYTEPKGNIRFLSHSEASLLISSCESETMKLFVLLGLHEGLRLEELLSLKWDHIDLRDRIIIIDQALSKNNKTGNIPMTQDVYEALKNAEQKGEFVICKNDGSRYVNIRKSWLRLVNKCGLTDCTPHVLRHTFATELVRSGADLMAVKELGRWSDLKMVQKYAHVAKDHRTRIIHLLDGKFLHQHKSDTNAKEPQNVVVLSN